MKNSLFTMIFFITTSMLNAQTNGENSSSDFFIPQTITENGIGFGAALAITISWSKNKSILWAIIHGIFGWFYVIYYALTRNNN